MIDLSVEYLGLNLNTHGDFTNSPRWISIIKDNVSCDLAASTGVHDGQTLVKMILAGAKAVQVTSAFYKNGVDYSKEMISFLKNWMEKKGYNKIEDFRGIMSQNETANPTAF